MKQLTLLKECYVYKLGEVKHIVLFMHYQKIKKRSMIVVDQEKIMLQWRDEFIKFTNLTEDDIYLISGRSSVDALMKKKKSEIRYKVIIAMHQTLGSLEKEVTDLYEHCKIGVNVFDEAHYPPIFNLY